MGVSCLTRSARSRSSSSSGNGSGFWTVGSQPVRALVRKTTGALVTVVGQRGVEVLHGQANLEVSHDERGGHDLETENALGGGLLDAGACESAESTILEVGGDASQRLGEVCAGAAAGIENVDVVGGQSVGDAEIVLEGAVDAGDHVSHHLGGCVPDAKLLAEVGIERLRGRARRSTGTALSLH